MSVEERKITTYEIYLTQMDDVSDAEGLVGVEIQPPLGELAARGLAIALKVGDQDPPAHIAEVTRDDEVGTALIVVPNKNNATNAKDLGRVIRQLIDPCALNIINLKTRPDVREVHAESNIV